MCTVENKDGDFWAENDNVYQINNDLLPYFTYNRNVHQKYFFGKLVGTGRISEVTLAIHKQLNVIVAVKKIKKKDMKTYHY